MMKDPIVEEFRQAGNTYAESFHHDLDAIIEDLRHRQDEHQDRIVSFADGEPMERASQEAPRSAA